MSSIGRVAAALRPWLAGANRAGVNARWGASVAPQAQGACAGAEELTEHTLMGRGDPKTRRGKIFKGSYGKCRPRPGKKLRERESWHHPEPLPIPKGYPTPPPGWAGAAPIQ